MIDDQTMRLMLENMESAAEEALRDDRAFYEALQSLKAEIDRDPRVQSAVRSLRDRGSTVFSSLIPRIRIRIRTNEGMIALPSNEKAQSPILVEPVAHLTRELKIAASAVIMRGRVREQLDSIMNQAICTNMRFEGIASEIERAGHEVVICLDLSAYAEVRGASQPIRNAGSCSNAKEFFHAMLSGQDLRFLKAMGINGVEK